MNARHRWPRLLGDSDPPAAYGAVGAVVVAVTSVPSLDTDLLPD